MTEALFLRDGEDPKAFEAAVRVFGVLHDAEIAFERIVHGYGVNHGSTLARNKAVAAIEALNAPAASPIGGQSQTLDEQSGVMTSSQDDATDRCGGGEKAGFVMSQSCADGSPPVLKRAAEPSALDAPTSICRLGETGATSPGRGVCKFCGHETEMYP